MGVFYILIYLFYILNYAWFCCFHYLDVQFFVPLLKKLKNFLRYEEFSSKFRNSRNIREERRFEFIRTIVIIK